MNPSVPANKNDSAGWRNWPINRLIDDQSRPEFRWLRTLLDRFHAPYNREALSPSVRQAISEEAGRLVGGQRAGDAVPEDLDTYVRKCALHAYRVTDSQIEKMKASGRSDDEIFEVTLAAVLGAATARLEKGLALLSENEKDPA